MTARADSWDPFALLLVDVQRDFWGEEMPAAFPGYEENVARLLGLCREAGIDIVHLRAEFRNDKSDWMTRYRLLDRIPCTEGTPGAEILPCASEAPGEPVIVKQTFDGFHRPELQAYLDKNDKRFILIAGLVTSVCVLLTAAGAAQRGYLVAVVEDCCADAPEAHRHTLERYPFAFSRTMVDGILDSREAWTADLGRLAGRESRPTACRPAG